jgi:hypothetical protein
MHDWKPLDCSEWCGLTREQKPISWAHILLLENLVDHNIWSVSSDNMSLPNCIHSTSLLYIYIYLQRQWCNRRTFLSFTLGASALALKQIYNHLLATEIRCTDWTELIIASRQLQYTCTWNTTSWCKRHYHSWSQRAGSVYDCEVLVVDFFHSGVESFSSQQTQAILVRESSRGLANGTIMVGLNVWVQLLD